ncbi:hypothetical protein Anas_06521 [Armadillidium nasatum]|uniref:Uncharacterized protein n=1 Tax=Armadillidium nasatum TaxID=96803 RepID=A0A5N5STT0_9CRUS|nr:hypothetical protein Anas_06521 [Armadillidium nasatum]
MMGLDNWLHWAAWFVKSLMFLLATTVLVTLLLCTPNSGATAVGTIWMFSYLPNIYLRPRFHSLSTNLKIGMCVYFNTAMSLGCFLASIRELV